MKIIKIVIAIAILKKKFIKCNYYLKILFKRQEKVLIMNIKIRQVYKTKFKIKMNTFINNNKLLNNKNNNNNFKMVNKVSSHSNSHNNSSNRKKGLHILNRKCNFYKMKISKIN